MSIEVIPAALFKLPHVKALLRDERACILHKTLPATLEHKAVYLTTPLIVHILQGSQRIRGGDGIDHHVKQGSLLLLPKGEYSVSDYVAEGGVFEAMLYFVDETRLARLMRGQGAASGAEPPGACVLPAGAALRGFAEALPTVYRHGANAALLDIKLAELLQLIALQEGSHRHAAWLCRASGRPLARLDIAAFMERHYGHKLRVEDYAQLTGRSLSSFVRDFKRAYRTTPHQWLMARKVGIAHELLVRDGYSVTDAAVHVGYDNTSHFIRAYKRQFGTTPHQAKRAAL
ncbi:MAG: AraC family transcriptional regulator [Gammaproteobacteria bacterium]